VGDSVTYIFGNSYKVPQNATYYLRLTAYLLCDSSAVNSISATIECADIHDVSIVRLDNPNTQTDMSGSVENVAVLIENKSDLRRYNDVNIIALIEDKNGQRISSRLDNISVIEPLSTQSFTFTESYTVPDDSVYYIRVYLTSVDNYPENDTLFVQRTTKNVGVSSAGENNVFTLGQNIPNPAKNTTRIDYSIPESGEVIFHVHSVSGQLLYSKTIEATSGVNSLEFNTNTLAAGIYVYSIEYKGQRLIKRMSVQK
jgi:hypothetical protein